MNEKEDYQAERERAQYAKIAARMDRTFGRIPEVLPGKTRRETRAILGEAGDEAGNDYNPLRW